MSPVKPMPTCPSLHPCCYLLSSLSLSLVPFLSLPLSSRRSPYPSRSSSVYLCRHPLPPMQPANAIRSARRWPSPSRDYSRAMSPLGLTHAIIPFSPPPPPTFPPRPFPRRDFLPSSAPILARFLFLLLLIVPASILDPLSLLLALFDDCANGAIRGPFFAVNFQFPVEDLVALERRLLSLL